MACGTPVIARSRGSMAELIRDGVNGHLVETLDEAITAVKNCLDLDRALVRRTVEHRFDADRMVSDYIGVYHDIVARNGERAAQLGDAG